MEQCHQSYLHFKRYVVTLGQEKSRETLNYRLLFRSSHFAFLVFGHFWQRSYENTKILCKICFHFARQYGQDGKKRRENHATKSDQKPKEENMG